MAGAPEQDAASISREIFSLDPEVRLPPARRTAPMQAPPPSGAPSPIDSLVVLIDSSGSGALDWERSVETVHALIDALGRGAGPSTPVHLAAFDQSYQPIYEGAIGDLSPAVWRHLLDLGAYGASNWALALTAAGATRGHFARVLLVGDGVATAGPRDQASLVALVLKLGAAGVKRLDVLAFGDARDDALLTALVKASPHEPGVVIDGDLPLAEIARRLSVTAPESAPEPRVPGPEPKHRAPSPEPYAEVMALLPAHAQQALERAVEWHLEAPFEPLPLLAVGEAYAIANDASQVPRVYGSLIDLYPANAEMLRLAASLLQMQREQSSVTTAVEALDRAIALQPERPSSHRLLAYALLRAQREAEALAAVERGIAVLPNGPAQLVLRHDAGLIAAAWIRKEPAKRTVILSHLIPLGVTVETQPSLTFSLYWESEADVALSVSGSRGSVPLSFPSVAIVRGEPRTRAYPYRPCARVGGLGPLGFTAGHLEIVEHDGKGGLWFAGRSFVVTKAGEVELGEIARPFGKSRGVR